VESARQRDRRIKLQGSYNFRDIGGYAGADGRTVRWQRVFRSDALARLTEDDLATLRPIGVRTLIDLRTIPELEQSGPSQLIDAHGVRHRHHPFFQDPVHPDRLNELPDLPLLYAGLIEQGAETIRGIFEALADDATYPAVVHCAAGKDRTGIVIALLLRTLGVDDETIVTDYALTETYFTEYTDAQRRAGVTPLFDGLRPELLSAHAETMFGFLQVVDTRFGGAGQLLADSGVPAGAASELRNLLLEPRKA
jgi:protein tyrosine/serine phosphatase